MIQKVYEQKLKAGDVHADSWKATTEEYWKAIKEGWEKAPQFYSKAQLAMLELRRNVNVFSAFKNHANIIELTQALAGEDGKPKSFSEFKKMAAVIDEKYNKNWLQAEYKYAVNAARSAAQWQGFKERGGKLEYFTIGDGRVRDEHRKLHGTIMPVDHPFWDLYYPPNGWNCRCYVRWRSESTESKPPTSIPDVKEMFRNNVGETSQIFTNEHPFIAEIGSIQSQKIRALAEAETITWERKFIQTLLSENAQGKVVPMKLHNRSVDITISRNGLGKSLSQQSDNKIDQMRALLSIEELMKDAQYLGVIEERKGRSDIKQWHYFSVKHTDKSYVIILKEGINGQITFYTFKEDIK